MQPNDVNMRTIWLESLWDIHSNTYSELPLISAGRPSESTIPRFVGGETIDTTKADACDEWFSSQLADMKQSGGFSYAGLRQQLWIFAFRLLRKRYVVDYLL